MNLLKVFTLFLTLAVIPVFSNFASADDLPRPRPVDETCKIINGIRVCDKKPIPGEYMCEQFATDFDKECETAGIPCWKTYCIVKVIGLDILLRGEEGPPGHVMNTVEIQPPKPTPNRLFCLVEPQSNKNVCCWYQRPGADPKPPQQCVDKVIKLYPEIQPEIWKDKPVTVTNKR